MNAAWLDATDLAVAFMRLAKNSCACGGIIWFALIQSEGRYIHQRFYVGSTCRGAGDHRASVGVTDQYGRLVVHGQESLRHRNIVRKRCERDLRCGDCDALRLQQKDHFAPTRSIGPCAVYQHYIDGAVHKYSVVDV
jgi:hypothetical protein